MSYNPYNSHYSNNNGSHSYSNNNGSHRNNSRIPDSGRIPETMLVNSNTTPRKQTLIRNQSFQNRHYNQDLIQLIARIRSLQDDLISQKFKNQSLERKLMDYEKTIDNLEYEITSQSYQLQKYQHEIELSNQKNIEILKYEQNLKIVGGEIEQLNDALISKNKDCNHLLQNLKNTDYQLKKIEEEGHLLRVNQVIWKKQLQFIIDQFNSFLEMSQQQLDGSKNAQNNSLNIQNRRNEPPSQNNSPLTKNNRNGFSFPSQNRKQALTQRQQLNSSQQSLTFNFNNLTQQLNKRTQLLKSIFYELTSMVQKQDKQSAGMKSQFQFKLIKEKERFIKLEYQLKLQQERVKDSNKRQDLAQKYQESQRKVQGVIEQLIGKQEQYIQRIQLLTEQNQSLRQELTQIEQNNALVEKVTTEQKSHIIQSLKKQNQILQTTIEALTQKIHYRDSRIQDALAISKQQKLRQQQNQAHTNRKIRNIEEQNLTLQIRVEQLIGEVNMLSKQIQIVKGYEDDDLQSPR